MTTKKSATSFLEILELKIENFHQLSDQSAGSKNKLAQIRKKRDAVKKCIDSPELNLIWIEIGSSMLSTHHKPLIYGTDWLANAIFKCYPTFENVLPKGDAKKWSNSVVESLTKLVDQLNDPPSNYLYNEHFYRKYLINQLQESRSLNKIQEPLEYSVLNFLGVSELPENVEDVISCVDDAADKYVNKFIDESNLDDIVLTLKTIARCYTEPPQNESYFSDRRVGYIGERSYFVRALTRGFIGRTNFKNYNAIAAITDVLFDGDISPNQIQSLTKDIRKKPKDFYDLTEKPYQF